MSARERFQKRAGSSPEGRGLLDLFRRLVAFKVHVFGANSDEPVDGKDREAVPLDEAHVVSSLLPEGRHVVAIDIDHPTWLVKSSTPGHYHLYIDVPGGINWVSYRDLLEVLAHCGVIERGYADVSIERGHSDLRLPWIKKGQEQ